MVSCHNDGNPLNNNINNLRWDTQKNNLNDRVKHKTILIGEKNVLSKLKNSDIKKIFSMERLGESQRYISKMFRVSQCSIHNVLSRKTWKHIKIKEV